jgi:hypothetical protein
MYHPLARQSNRTSAPGTGVSSAIAWAWGINGLFTVLGGGIAGVISVFVDFKVVFLIAMGVYLLALLALAWAPSRVASIVPHTIPEQPFELPATV